MKYVCKPLGAHATFDCKRCDQARSCSRSTHIGVMLYLKFRCLKDIIHLCTSTILSSLQRKRVCTSSSKSSVSKTPLESATTSVPFFNSLPTSLVNSMYFLHITVSIQQSRKGWIFKIPLFRWRDGPAKTHPHFFSSNILHRDLWCVFSVLSMENSCRGVQSTSDHVAAVLVTWQI